MGEKCYKCHEYIDENLFCPYCGTLQKCLACDTPFQTEGKFCGECGVEKGQRGNKEAQALHNNDAEHAAMTQEEAMPEVEPSEASSKAQGERVHIPTVQPNKDAEPEKGQAVKTKSESKWPMILIVAGFIVAIIAAYMVVSSNNSLSSPEATVEGFIEAMDERNEDKLAAHIMPSIVDEVMEEVDFDDIPEDAIIELSSITDVEYLRDSMVDVATEVLVTAEELDGTETGYLDFELVKVKKKWYISNIY